VAPQAGPIAPDPGTRSDIAHLVALYHEGIHHGDVDKLARAFHPDARLLGEVKGAPYRKSLAEYLAIVRSRVAPAAAGHAQRGEILSLDVRGGVALAVVFTPVAAVDYIDFLALIRTDDGWRIASKLFTDVR
jgi:Putative lumazine-binding